MLCMANSRKSGGRCIAGLVPEKDWIRPVSNPQSGALSAMQCKLGEQHSIQPLDIVSLPIEQEAPLDHQRENLLIADRRWHFLKSWSVDSENTVNFLSDCEYDRDLLFGDRETAISFATVKETELDHSLALVRTKRPRFKRVEDHNGEPRFRSYFDYKDVTYEMPITFETFLEQIPHLEVGNIHKSISDWWFTISLGEPFIPQHRSERFCYKLIAGAIEIP